MLWLSARSAPEREPALHWAPQKCSNKPGHLISEEIYIFLLSGNEQILINVKTAISDLTARFFMLILFAPRNTGNENLLCLSHCHCIFKFSANRLAFSPLSPSLVNRGKLLWAKDWEITSLRIPQPWLSYQQRPPSLQRRKRGWLGRTGAAARAGNNGTLQ